MPHFSLHQCNSQPKAPHASKMAVDRSAHASMPSLEARRMICWKGGVGMDANPKLLTVLSEMQRCSQVMTSLRSCVKFRIPFSLLSQNHQWIKLNVHGAILRISLGNLQEPRPPSVIY